MPSKGRIQSRDFQELLIELGVNQNGIPFDLRSEVQPVVLVGGTVSFVAAPTPAYRVPDLFSVGVLIAPAAGSVLADTGPLPAGAYSVQLFMDAGEAAHFRLLWRDVPDASSLWFADFHTPDETNVVVSVRLNVENSGEIFRVINPTAGGVGIQYVATIAARI